jgi:hypothetical protein
LAARSPFSGEKTMDAKVVRPFLNGKIVARRGEILDLPDMRAKALVKKGLVVPATSQAEDVEAAGTASIHPSSTPQHGGQTGEATPSSLSPEGQAQRASRSRKHADEAG